MKKIVVAFILAVLPLLADDVQTLKEDLQTRVNAITSYLANTGLNKTQKNEKILETVEPVLDFALMSKLSLDKNVRLKMNEDQLKEFSILFEKELKDSFLTKLENYSNEKIELKNGVKTQPTRIAIASVIKGKGEDMDVVFKYYLASENLWKIYDLEIAGVSLIQTYRTQFSEVMANSGAVKLLEKLRTKR